MKTESHSQQSLKSTIDKKNSDAEFILRQSGQTLLKIPGLPPKIKRELRDLLNFSGIHQISNTEQVVRLINLYERSIKIFTMNPELKHRNMPMMPGKELLNRLSDELQTLITELDFSGEAGDTLMDIHARLLNDVASEQLIGLTLEVLRLIIQGTAYERNRSEQYLKQINSSLASCLSSIKKNIERQHALSMNRQTMHQELTQLIQNSHTVMNESQDIHTLKTELSRLLEKYTALSARFKASEKHDHSLLETLDVTQNRIETSYEVTQNFCQRLEDQAERALKDPLTKVYNRTAFYHRLELEYHRWIRTRHPLRLALLDIDNFKSINQQFGYPAGDKALKIIARTIMKELSDTDTVARFSGEEFLLILPERKEQENFSLIQSIQHQIRSLPFKFKDKELTITISSICLPFQEDDMPDELVERLYQLLFKNKDKGPDQSLWQ